MSSLASKSQLRANNGGWRTLSLFKETCKSADRPLWSLEEWRRIYIEQADPTEYRAALALVPEWSIWLALRKNETLASQFDSWLTEVKVKVASDVHFALLDAVKAGAAGSSAAAKEVLSMLTPADKRPVGRPRKDKSPPLPDPKQTAADAKRLSGMLPKK